MTLSDVGAMLDAMHERHVPPAKEGRYMLIAKLSPTEVKEIERAYPDVRVVAPR